MCVCVRCLCWTDNTEWKGCMEFTLSDSAQTSIHPSLPPRLDSNERKQKKTQNRTEQKTHCAYSNNLAHSRHTTSSNCARHTASRRAFLLCPDPILDPDPTPLSFAAALAALRAAVCGPLPSSASARRPTSAQSDMLLVAAPPPVDGEGPVRRDGPRRV